MSQTKKKLFIDTGSTYFKVCTSESITRHFRDFDKDLLDDLMYKCGDTLKQYEKDDTYVCSSANGGLNTLIIGVSKSFSLKYATNIAFNSGINIIDTILYQDIEEYATLDYLVDVVIVVGGVGDHGHIFGDALYSYLDKIDYSNVVYVGNEQDALQAQEKLDNLVVLPNIIDNRLHIVEEHLKGYLTNLYQLDIEGKEDIKNLYQITNNQIFSTPYIVNQALPLIDANYSVVDPFIVLDIGGATTDIHYSKDLVIGDNIVTENEYDRMVFKKLGVYKSRESLIFAAKNNEFVYELLMHLKVTENIFEEESDKATKILMQLAIFLVMCKISHYRPAYINLKLLTINSIVITGGITQMLSKEEVEDIISFFYTKILTSQHRPVAVIDSDYDIWTLGARKMLEAE